MQHDLHDARPISPQTLNLLAGLLLWLAAFSVYNPALSGGFVWDDLSLVGNPWVTTSDGLVQVWTQPGTSRHEDHYWPMVYTVFWLEHRAWGFWLFGFHLVNIALHAANAWLVWILLRRLRVKGAWLAGMIFALHPVHAESVAWIIELKDVLSAFFYLLAGYLFFRSRPKPSPALYGLSLLLFALAILSKSVAITLPMALGIGLWWQEGRLQRRDLLRLLPYFGVALVVEAVDLWSIHQVASQAPEFGAAQRVLLCARAFWFYLGKLLWPYPLMAIYPRWSIQTTDPWAYVYLAAFLALAALLFALRKRSRSPLAAFAFYFVTLAPTLGFVTFTFMEYSLVADRFQYLASLGPIALFSGALAHLHSHLAAKPRIALVAAVAVLLAALGGLTWARSNVYKSQESLFTNTLKHNPQAVIAHTALGIAAQQRRDSATAEKYFRQALSLTPKDAQLHYLLATTFVARSQWKEAEESLNQAIALQPRYANALALKGVVEKNLGRPNAAIRASLQALEIAPTNPLAQKILDSLTSASATK